MPRSFVLQELNLATKFFKTNALLYNTDVFLWNNGGSHSTTESLNQ